MQTGTIVLSIRALGQDSSAFLNIKVADIVVGGSDVYDAGRFAGVDGDPDADIAMRWE
ncbi:MAG: hypothetical protein ACK2UC_15135 [Anaerolineae bacterium]